MAVKFDPILDKLREKDTDADSIDIGDTVTDGTAGSVLFVGAAATLAQDNANLFFNDTTNRLGVGVTDPDSKVEVLATTTQQKWSYDADSFTTMTVADASHTTVATGESGNLTLDSAGDLTLDADSGTMTFADGGATLATIASLRQESFMLACSDETTALTTGVKVTFRMPYAFTLTSVKASVTTAPTTSDLIVDIDDSGSSIFTTDLLTIDDGDTTSVGSGTTPNITDASLAADAVIVIDITQIGSGTAGAGLKVTLIGHQTV